MDDLHGLVAAPGANDGVYLDPAMPDRPIRLHAARPRDWTPAMPVLLVHHGVLRNGGDYRDYWLDLVDAAGVLAIVPEFSNEKFPGAEWYNFGNRADADGRPKPREEWTYGVDGRLIAALRAAGVTRHPRHGAFGHSAGGQFVHRMVSLGFRDGLAIAITANAGTYAWPDRAVAFPFGLGGTGIDDDALGALLRFPLTVAAGTADVDTESPHFPKDAAAMRQGPTRHARAHAYVAAARAAAAALGMECAWTIVDAPGIDHDGARMSAHAAPLVRKALHGA